MFIGSAVLAAFSLWLSRVEFAVMKDYVDAHAPDGDVKSFDAPFNARMQQRFASLTWILAAVSAITLVGRRFFFSAAEAGTGQLAVFKSDVRGGLSKLLKRTSIGHKRLVGGIIIVGAILRISQMGLPVIYDEAFTYTNYASQPLHFLFSDYTFPNNHILHSFLVKLSTGLFGVHLWSLRLPALLAGIAVMPLFYVFTRVMFNRYIALITLAFVAGSGALIEYSALARGYSLTWLFMVCAMLVGRHFAKTNNLISALFMALFNALGMWTVPTMIYPSLMVYIWLMLYIIFNYDTTMRRRLFKLALSAIAFILLTLLVYTPVIVVHSVDQLVHHPALSENTWSDFLSNHQDKAFELWLYFNDTAATWISIIGFVGLAYAAYVSTKYRMMLVAMIISSVPLVLVQHVIGPPRVWCYILFILHLSSGIALFYFLKLIQDRVYKGFAKRLRTAIASVTVLIGMGWLGITGLKDRITRYPDAQLAVDWLNGVLKPGDRVLAQFPWEAPFEFDMIASGLDRQQLNRGPAPGGNIYALVGPAPIDGNGAQSVTSVFGRNELDTTPAATMVKVKDWRMLEIFAAR